MNAERFALDWVSAAEATRFVQLITAFTKRIQEMGPLGQAEGRDREDLLLRLQAARLASEGMKLRSGLGKLAKEFREEGDYSLEGLKKRLREKLGPIVRSELGGQEILLRLGRQGPIALELLASKTGLSGEEAAGHLQKFSKKGLVVEKDGVWSLAAAG